MMVLMNRSRDTVDNMVSFLGISIESEEIVNFLKQDVQLKDVCRQIVCRQIIRRSSQECEVDVTPDEIQAEGDRIRYKQRLESASATFSWLRDQLITPEDWEMGIRDRLLAKKLAEHLYGKQVETYFAQHRIDFDQVQLYRIMVPYEPLAQELRYRIEENEISFCEAAHLYDLDERRRLQSGYDGTVRRWDFEPEAAAQIFGVRVGDVIGPILSEPGYSLLMVEKMIQAELTPDIYQEILDMLFKEWLDSELTYLINHRNSSHQDA